MSTQAERAMTVFILLLALLTLASIVGAVVGLICGDKALVTAGILAALIWGFFLGALIYISGGE